MADGDNLQGVPEVEGDANKVRSAAYLKAINSARAQKGWLTRKGNDLKQACQELQDNPSSFSSTQVDNAFDVYKHRMEKLEEAFATCVLEDNVGEYARWEKAYDNFALEMSQARGLVTKIMATAAAVIKPVYQAPVVNAGAPKLRNPINETLKPPVLSLGNSPIEFRHWSTKLQSFFSSNQLADATIPEQQAYVRQFIDADLEVRIQIQIDDTVEIFGQNGVLAVLEGEFKKRYPLFSRRLEYFRYSRQPGQAASNFVAKLVQLSFEADLTNLTTDQLQVYRVLTGIKEDQLLGKLLDLKEMNFDNVQKKITQWEVNRASKASVSNRSESGASASAATRVNQVSSTRPQQNQSSRGQTGGCLSPADLRGKCACCGSPKHMKAACPSKDKALCSTCGKNGHWKSVCLRDFFAKQGQQGGGGQSRAGRPSPGTPAATRVASVSDASFTQFQQE